MNTLSHNLKTLLEQAKLSENELARRTGVAQQVINRILSGANQNPKIATLNPLANYFMVSISQLIGDEHINPQATSLNPLHQGWREIPHLTLEQLAETPLDTLLSQQNQMILIDLETSHRMFALTMPDHSMEPKFSKNTLLIIDADRTPSHGEFILIGSANNTLKVRQILIKNQQSFIKCLNPTHPDYHPNLLPNEWRFLGSIVQSRTNHLPH